MKRPGVILAVGIVIGLTMPPLFHYFKNLNDSYLRDPSRGGYELTILSQDGGLLWEDDPVAANGVIYGKVKKVTLNGSTVVSRIKVSKKLAIPFDSKITIAEKGLLGNKMVSIRLGKFNKYLKANDTVVAESEKGILGSLFGRDSTSSLNVFEKIDSVYVISHEIRKRLK